jgi:aryl-alcohol dehydrogenase-like predicted oxidoreductase
MKYLEVDGIGKVSGIGVGTWQFGSREWGYGDTYAADVARDIVQRALALGVTLFDTAEDMDTTSLSGSAAAAHCAQRATTTC